MAHKNILKLAKSEFLKPKNRRLRNGLIVLLCLIIFADIAFPNSVGWTRLVLNTLGYAGLLLVYVYSGLNLSDLGLSLKNIKRGVFFGFVISLIIMIGYSIVFMIQPNLFHDSRYHQNLWSAFFAVLILLPLKTVLLEELIFRGILPGILTKMYNPKVALYGSAILFGLWHIMPSLHVRSFPVGNFFTLPGYLFIMVSILVTSFAGYLFMRLRNWSGSLMTTIMVHWTINTGAIILIALSWRIS